MEFRKMVMITLYAKQRHMYRTDFWTLWEKARVGCFERRASKHVYYLQWNRSPAQVGCMRQVLRPGALGRPRGFGWRGRREGGSGWWTHVTPWLIRVNVWQKPLQYCKVISLQLIKINGKKETWERCLAGPCEETERRLSTRQEESSHQTANLLPLWFWTSCIQNWEMNVVCLSHQFLVFCYSGD